MGKHVQLAPHLSMEALERRYRQTRETTERSWWQILWLLARGNTARAVAQNTGYSAYWIGQVARRYNIEGPDGMVNRRRTARRRAPTLLSSAQLEELRTVLAGSAPQGDRWTSRTVAAWMAERLGRPVARQRGWDYLQRLGARLRTPRPRHVAADAEAQTAFKKGCAD